jgi:ATP-dependent DNA ligase
LTKCPARIDLKRYPLIVESTAHIQGSAILDAEVVWLGLDGIAQLDALHSRVNDGAAIALAFDLLMHNGEDVRRRPFAERKAILRKVLQRTRRGIQYVEHTEGDGVECSKPSGKEPSPRMSRRRNFVFQGVLGSSCWTNFRQ